VRGFIVLEILLHQGEPAAAEIAKRTRLADASVEITMARLKEQNLIELRHRQGKESAFRQEVQGNSIDTGKVTKDKGQSMGAAMSQNTH